MNWNLLWYDYIVIISYYVLIFFLTSPKCRLQCKVDWQTVPFDSTFSCILALFDG